MKNGVFTIFLLVFTFQLHAQFGLRVSAAQNDYKNWNTIISSASTPANTDIFNTSYELGVDYWFRFKNVRIEFFPEIGIGLSKSKNPASADDMFPQSYNLRKVYGGINAHFYLFDLKNDCKCPTFSKQNDFLKKGLFVLLGSKAHFQNKETIFNSDKISHNDLAIEITGGVGLDIGLSDLITISPFVALSYFPSSEWQNINANHGIINILPPDETTRNLAYKIGIRIGFRPDYLKNN